MQAGQGEGRLFPHPHKLLLAVPRINGRVGDRDVTQVNLHGANIVTVVDHVEPATMAQHMRVHAGQGGCIAALLQELIDGASSKRRPALRYKEPGKLRFTFTEVAPHKPQLISSHRVHPVNPVLAALHEEGRLFQVQLLKLDAA